jgi:hypothetical protein
MSANARAASVPAEMPESGLPGRLCREVRNVGEAYFRQRFETAASAATRTRCTGAEQGREQQNRAYFQHLSHLIARAKRRHIAADMVMAVFGDYAYAINGRIGRPCKEA